MLFTIEKRGGRGRCCIAAQDIPALTPIMGEEAFVHVVNDGGYRCFGCLEVCETEPCGCCGFCSERCRQRAFEAGYALLCECTAEKGIARFEHPYLGFLCGCISKLAACSDTARTQFWELAAEAVVPEEDVETCWKVAVDVFGGEVLESVVGADVEMFRRMYSILRTNSISLLGSPFSVVTGLFLNFSMFNHSCRCNAEDIPSGTSIAVCSMTPIRRGEEICISYCERLEPYDARQKYLKENFSFDCKCEMCVEDGEQLTRENMQRDREFRENPRCLNESCEGVYVRMEDRCFCNTCESELPVPAFERMHNLLGETVGISATVQKLVGKGLEEEALECLEKGLEITRKFGHAYNGVHAMLLSKHLQLLLRHGTIEQIMQERRELIKVYEFLFPEENTLVEQHYFLAEDMFNAGMEHEAVTYARKVLKEVLLWAGRPCLLSKCLDEIIERCENVLFADAD